MGGSLGRVLAVEVMLAIVAAYRLMVIAQLAQGATLVLEGS